MNKQDFLDTLRAKLSGLPKQDVEERLDFYSEMIDDRMEEGLSEEEAVLGIGSVEEIAEQIVAEISLTKIVKEKIKPKKKIKAWEIVLLALGSPIWLSLAVAALAVILALYAVIWSVLVSLWAVFGAVVGVSLCGVAAGVILICLGNVLTGIGMIGAGIASAGLAIFLFFGCKEATKGTLWLTKRIALSIKNRFVKKEEA